MIFYFFISIIKICFGLISFQLSQGGRGLIKEYKNICTSAYALYCCCTIVLKKINLFLFQNAEINNKDEENIINLSDEDIEILEEKKPFDKPLGPPLRWATAEGNKGEIYKTAFIPAGPTHQRKHPAPLLQPSASIYQGTVYSLICGTSGDKGQFVNFTLKRGGVAFRNERGSAERHRYFNDREKSC